MTEVQADSLLRVDLMKLCRMCSRFGKDALLVATLSYNVGYYRLVGYGKIPKSRLIQKLEAGDRNIYDEYISFRCYKGKVVQASNDEGKRSSDSCTYLNCKKPFLKQRRGFLQILIYNETYSTLWVYLLFT